MRGAVRAAAPLDLAVWDTDLCFVAHCSYRACALVMVLASWQFLCVKKRWMSARVMSLFSKTHVCLISEESFHCLIILMIQIFFEF